MELNDFLDKYRITSIAKSIAIVWLAYVFYAVLLSALGVSSLFASRSLQLILASVLFASMIASMLLAATATFGIFAYGSPSSRKEVLFKLWIFPFIGSIIYLALRKENGSKPA